MNDVIFDAQQQSKEEGGGPETVSKEILQEFKDYFNDLEYRTLVALKNYHTSKQEWPTYKELARFMDEKPGNIQPRLSELRESQVVVQAGKRPCSVSDHGRSVSTFKPVHKQLAGDEQ